MRPFAFERASDAADAQARHAGGGAVRAGRHAAYIAGGTTMVDLLKLGVAEPSRLVEILDLRRDHAAITADDRGLDIGALATMAEVERHPALRPRWAAVADAIEQAASPQIREVATIGGSLLQRTRCSYFRDRHSACNKRAPDTGCAAIGGRDRALAVLGTSPHCIANYPGDLAVALVAMDATMTVLGADGASRVMPVEDLHREPGDRPDIETTLATSELITEVHVPDNRWTKSLYLKARDRESYAFALASAAVAVRMEGDVVVDVRIALGGLATRPWRCRDAEALLRGRLLDGATAREAADACLAGADRSGERAFKADLGRLLVVDVLHRARLGR